MSVLALGFTDPVTEAQQVFDAVMSALALPGRVRPLYSSLEPPRPLTRELAAVALALADHEAPIWLDAQLAGAAGVAEFLRFHTGASIVADPSLASFALIADPKADLPIEHFGLGSAEYPDRSTTLVYAVSGLSEAVGWQLSGPGIADRQSLSAAPWPQGLADIVRANRTLFPRGIDVLLTAPGVVAGLPRSTRLVEEV